MDALLKMGAPIAALVTHRDDPHEEIWWRSCATRSACEQADVWQVPEPLPVVEGGRLIGMLTETDVLRYFAGVSR